MVASGSCPSSFSEVSALNGAMPYGTVAANGDVGTSGGSNSITPAGTNSTVTGPAQVISWPMSVPTFSGSSGTVPAESFTGSSVSTSSNSAGTPAGTNSTVTGPAQTISWPAGVPAFAGTPFTSVINHTHTVTTTWNVQGGTTAATTGTHVMTSTATGGSARAPTTGDVISATTANPSGGVTSITPAGTISWPAGVPTNATSTIPAETFTGTALSGHSHTVTATGTNGTVSFTPAGTVAWPVSVPTNSISTIPAETWTGTAFDNRSAWYKVIFCVKT